MKTQILNKIWFFAFITLPSLVIAGSTATESTLRGLSSNASISDIVLLVTLIAGLLTILTVAIKSVKNGNNNQKSERLEELKAEYTKLADQVTDLTKLDVASKIHTIETDLHELDHTVNNYLKRKLYDLSEKFTILETKVVDLNKHFDSFNQDRKEEHRQVKLDINKLRENIREDINDVKDIIMKLMMVLKTDPDQE